MADVICENCVFYTYDEEYEDYMCDVSMDEDEIMRIESSKYKKCPYFRDGDDYKIVKKQN